MHTCAKTGLFLCAFLLAACGQRPGSAEVQTSQAPAKAVPAPAPAAATKMLWFAPNALPACGPATQVVRVNWDLSSKPEVASVEIRVVENGAPEGLFARTSPVGNKDTGPWMHAGSTMLVRDAATGAELARATMGSIPCP